VVGGSFTNRLPAQSVTTFVQSEETGCTPTSVVPYIQINAGTWQQTASATLNEGSSVNFSPQPAISGSWSWSGPNGYNASTREITFSSIVTSQAGNYIATYTNTSGCKSTMKVTISITATSIIHVRGTCGSNLKLHGYDKNAEMTVYDLKGASAYRKLGAANGIAIPDLKKGMYIVCVKQDKTLITKKVLVK